MAAIGHMLGPYHIVAKLGEGGMGVVYRAHDATLQRDVALKVLPPELAGEPDRRARLLREARAAASLNHPNVCTVYEVGEADGQAYIAMELVDGQPLSVRLVERPLPVDDIVGVALQLADALAHAHERGVVHRDLKSANVIVTPEGRVKVLDFGLAKRVNQELADAATRTSTSIAEHGTVLGTLPYMAPEQLRGQAADARSDIWALGVIVYEMAAGARPFRGQTAFAVSASILNEPPQPLPGRVAAPLRALIGRCLEKEPARRYQRAGEVRAALEVLASGPHAGVAGSRPPGRRRLLAFTAAAAAALALIAGVAISSNVGGVRRRLFGAANAAVTSLAVLPLDNLSNDREQEYFVAGMHEALITDLARIGVQKVIAKASADAFKGTGKSLRDIGRELGVDGLITGSVMRGGDRLQITAQLVRPETGEVLWANRYDRRTGDAMTVQNEIVAAIAREVRGTIAPERAARRPAAHPVNPEAHDAYLRARFLFSNFSVAPDATQLAAAYAQFERAIAIDPSYAQPYAAYSIALQAAPQISMQSPQTTLARARAHAQKAIELDEQLPEAHAALAAVLFWNDWNWAAADRETQRALELNANSVDALTMSEELTTLVTAKSDDAAATSQRILALDPLNPFSRIQVGWVAFFSRRYDDSVRALTSLLELYPDHMFGRMFRAPVYAALHRRDEARGDCRKVIELLGPGYYNQAIGSCVWALATVGEMADARRLLDRLAHPPPGVWVDPVIMGNAYGGVGDIDRAMTWYQQGFDERAPNMTYMKVGPQWDSARNDPRFHALLRRMNFPP